MSSTTLTSANNRKATKDVCKHTHHDNGGAVRGWKVLAIRPPLRGAMAFAETPF